MSLGALDNLIILLDFHARGSIDGANPKLRNFSLVTVFKLSGNYLQRFPHLGCNAHSQLKIDNCNLKLFTKHLLGIEVLSWTVMMSVKIDFFFSLLPL